MTDQSNDIDSVYHAITKPAFEKDPWDHDYYDFVDTVDANLKMSGVLSDRPSASNAPDDAWYEATDQSLIYRNDPTNGWVVIGGTGDSDDDVPEGHFNSLNVSGSFSASGLVGAGSDVDSAISVGDIKGDSATATPYTVTETVGFEPRYIEFHATFHRAGLNTVDERAGVDVPTGDSHGFAAGTATGDQYVTGNASDTNNQDNSASWAGDGEVVRLPEVLGGSTAFTGNWCRGSVTAINVDGFDFEWAELAQDCHVVYRAYR